MLSLKNCILLASALMLRHVGAVCTNWTVISNGYDDARSFSTIHSIPVVHRACPYHGPEKCSLDEADSYDINAIRDIYMATKLLQLPEKESSAIFNLARDAYNSDFAGSPNFVNATFESIIKTTVYPDKFFRDNYWLVEQGLNKTLFWTAYYQWSVGTLSGCTNNTLNNKTIIAAAPYYTLGDDNRTVIAGSWSVSWSNTTISTAAPMFRGSSVNTYSTALLAGILGLSFVLL